MIPIRVVFKNNDDKLLKIDELIEAKRQMLRDKEKTIGKIAQQNKFLEDVEFITTPKPHIKASFTTNGSASPLLNNNKLPYSVNLLYTSFLVQEPL